MAVRHVSRQPPPARRRPAPPSKRRRRRLRPALLVLVIGSMLVLWIAAWAVSVNSGVAPSAATQPVDVQYVVAPGDTSASVSALFQVDSAEVMRQAGVSAADTVLVAGSSLHLDASQLWTAMHRAPLLETEALVERQARAGGVEPALALAVAWQESRLQQSARSSTGAVGIMQVEPDTSRLAARDLGVALDPTVAADNVKVGVFWLHSLLTSYGGDQASTLAAYYEGPGNLARNGYVAGTAAYVSHGRQLRNALLAVAPHLGS